VSLIVQRIVNHEREAISYGNSHGQGERSADIKVLGSRRVECAQVRQHLARWNFLLSFARGQRGDIRREKSTSPVRRGTFFYIMNIFGSRSAAQPVTLKALEVKVHFPQLHIRLPLAYHQRGARSSGYPDMYST